MPCLQIIRDMLTDPAARGACDRYIADRASRGLRSLGVCSSVDGGRIWHLVGLISLLDPPRPDSAETIRRAQGLGVEVRAALRRGCAWHKCNCGRRQHLGRRTICGPHRRLAQSIL